MNPRSHDSVPQNTMGHAMRGPNRFQRANIRPKNFFKTFWRLMSYFKNQRYVLVLILLLSLGASVAAMAGPFLIGLVIDNITSPAYVLRTILLIMILVYVCDSLAQFWQNFVVAGASQRLVKTMRKSLFDHLQSLPLKFFDRFMHGELMSRLSNDTDNIAGILGTALVQITSITITLTGVLVMMLWLSPHMTFFAMVSVPCFFIVTKLISKRTRRAFRAQQTSLGQLNAKIEEDITNVAVLQAYGSETRAVAEFAKINEQLRIAGTQAQIWSGFIMPAMNIINNLSLAVVALAGSVLAINGYITVGLIATFIAYSRQFGRPLNELAGTYNQFQSALVSCERVFEIMDELVETSDASDAIHLAKLKGVIDFKGVSFGYSQDIPIVSDITFNAQPGSITAIVGPTGAGKTTIVNLLARFYDVDSGQILIDGTDIRSYTRQSLRRTFGVVLQETYLFTDTILENLRYGNRSATLEEVEAAARMVGAHQFIAALPQGYDTVLTENSRGLSQGQRQLLAITRCVLANPQILILDEATSSVDTRTEIKIQEAMARLMQGRTSFVIAHRLRTIVSATQILVTNAGRIVQFGNHAELVSRGGVYKDMYDLQSKKV